MLISVVLLSIVFSAALGSSVALIGTSAGWRALFPFFRLAGVAALILLVVVLMFDRIPPFASMLMAVVAIILISVASFQLIVRGYRVFRERRVSFKAR